MIIKSSLFFLSLFSLSMVKLLTQPATRCHRFILKLKRLGPAALLVMPGHVFPVP